MLMDCKGGGGLQSLPTISATNWKTGFASAEFEIQRAGMDQIAYHRSLISRRVSDSNWVNWTGIGCVSGYPAAGMTNLPTPLTANS